jgi:hypothetical protein
MSSRLPNSICFSCQPINNFEIDRHQQAGQALGYRSVTSVDGTRASANGWPPAAVGSKHRCIRSPTTYAPAYFGLVLVLPTRTDDL